MFVLTLENESWVEAQQVKGSVYPGGSTLHCQSPVSSTVTSPLSLTCMNQQWPPRSRWSWTSPEPDPWTSCRSSCSTCHHKHCGCACSAHRHKHHQTHEHRSSSKSPRDQLGLPARTSSANGFCWSRGALWWQELREDRTRTSTLQAQSQEFPK